MQGEKLIIGIIVIAAVTFATRIVPFVIFGRTGTPPEIITYLGKYFPPAIICAILLYCLTGVSQAYVSSLAKEAISGAVVVALHLWKSNSMISIFSGVAVYMLLEQFTIS